MRKENLTYKELIDLMSSVVGYSYNLQVAFDSEYTDHAGCEGSDVPFTFSFDGKDFEIVGNFMPEDSETGSVVERFNIEY